MGWMLRQQPCGSESWLWRRRSCRVCFFFFSSRRRHTRCSRDWSSDVCSSDLHHLERHIEARDIFGAIKINIKLSLIFFALLSVGAALLYPVQSLVIPIFHIEAEIGRASCRERV